MSGWRPDLGEAALRIVELLLGRVVRLRVVRLEEVLAGLGS